MTNRKTAAYTALGFGLGAATGIVLDKYVLPLVFPGIVPGAQKLVLTPASVAQNGTFTAKVSGYPANTVIYGLAYNAAGGPPTQFTIGTTDGQGSVTASAQVTLPSGRWLMVAWDAAYRAAVAWLTVT